MYQDNANNSWNIWLSNHINATFYQEKMLSHERMSQVNEALGAGLGIWNYNNKGEKCDNQFNNLCLLTNISCS